MIESNLKLNVNEYISKNKLETKYSITEYEINDNKYKLVRFDDIDSTHKIANDIKDLKENEYIFFISEKQSIGVGQRNNKWASPKGNLYLSIRTLVRKNKEMNLLLIPQTTTLSIKNTLTSYTNENFQIKWINDLFYNDKKISGVLVNSFSADAVVENDKVDNIDRYFLTISLGVNLNISPIENSICLKEIINNDIDTNEFFERLCKQFLLYFDKLKKGETNMILLELNKNLLYLNSDVIIWDDAFENKLAVGKFTGINKDGCALLNIGQEIKTMIHGRMRLNKSKYVPVYFIKQMMKYVFYSTSLTIIYLISRFVYRKYRNNNK